MFCKQQSKLSSHHLCFLFFKLLFVAVSDLALCFRTGQDLLRFAVNYKDTPDHQGGGWGVMTFNKWWSFFYQTKSAPLATGVPGEGVENANMRIGVFEE